MIFAKKHQNNFKSKGFTLVEVLIILPVMMMTIALLINAFFYLYSSLSEQNAKINLRSEAQNILFSLQDDLLYANAFQSTISSDLTDNYSSNYTSLTDASRLIVAAPALTASHRDANKSFVYIDTLGCVAPNLDQNDIAYDNYVYFKSGNDLYKRVITLPPSTATCGTNFRKRTCPISAGTTGICQSVDIKLSDKVDTFTLTYYSENNVVVTDPSTAKRAKIYIKFSDKVNAEPFTYEINYTVKRIN